MSESEEDYSVHEDEDDEEEDEGDFEDEDEEEGGAEVENVGGDEDDEGDFENDEVPQKTSSPAKRKAGTGTKSGASESKRSKVEEASKLSTKKSTKTTKRKGKVVADEEGDTTPDGLAPTDSPDAKRENPASSANLTGHQNHNFAAPSSPKQEADSRRKSSTLGSGGSESSQQQEGSSAEKGQEDTNEDEAKKKKKKKAAVSKELKNKMRGEDPRAKILHQMYKRNRPGNVASVEGWTGHKIPKGIVQNVLEEMAKSGELKTKDTNGKNKIYWFNQSLFKIKPKDASKLKAEVEDLQTQLGQVQEENTECTKELRRLEATPPDSELEKTVAELEQTRSELSARLTAVRSASVDITPAERQKQRQLFMTYREAWLKRKRQCLDALGTISDAMEKKTKDMMSLVGIETDEDANAAVPPSLGGGFEVNKRPAKIGTKKRR